MGDDSVFKFDGDEEKKRIAWSDIDSEKNQDARSDTKRASELLDTLNDEDDEL